MSQFYHNFVPGFNFWYITIPAMLIAMYFVGKKKYQMRRTRNGRRIVRTAKKVHYQALSVIVALILTIEIAAESGTGLFQFFCNHLTSEDDPFWAFMLTVVSIAALTLILYGLAYRASLYGAAKKLHQLRNQNPQM
ncbi:hypothetical protein IJI00_03060 [Candidatus Saccharibacteria bacterium]|nr:hypothetical protein [Candidatus Saccharibacteria bacterium]